jgi:hypothetical protein
VSVSEALVWAMMIPGFAGIGAVTYRPRSHFMPLAGQFVADDFCLIASQ